MEWFDLPQLWCRWVQRSILESPQISEPAAKTRPAELASCLQTALPKTIYQTQQQLETTEITKIWLLQGVGGGGSALSFDLQLKFRDEILAKNFIRYNVAWVSCWLSKRSIQDYVFSTNPADLSSQDSDCMESQLHQWHQTVPALFRASPGWLNVLQQFHRL